MRILDWTSLVLSSAASFGITSAADSSAVLPRRRNESFIYAVAVTPKELRNNAGSASAPDAKKAGNNMVSKRIRFIEAAFPTRMRPGVRYRCDRHITADERRQLFS